jgi:hypothetical protein
VEKKQNILNRNKAAIAEKVRSNSSLPTGVECGDDME